MTEIIVHNILLKTPEYLENQIKGAAHCYVKSTLPKFVPYEKSEDSVTFKAFMAGVRYALVLMNEKVLLSEKEETNE